MKLQVSAELCRGHGRCYTVAPDLLEDDEDEGFVTVRGQIIDVPDDQVDEARNAAGSCPERAITLIETEARVRAPGARRRCRRQSPGWSP